jgi:fatty-acyl-CoA synthase
MNLADVLRIGAVRYADRELVLCEGRRFTYAEFNARVNRLASGLAGLGIGRDDLVASLAHNCDAQLALYFALAKLGAISVPLNTMLLPAEIDDIVDRSGARVLVHGSEFAERVASVTVPVRLTLAELP